MWGTFANRVFREFLPQDAGFAVPTSGRRVVPFHSIDKHVSRSPGHEARGPGVGSSQSIHSSHSCVPESQPLKGLVRGDVKHTVGWADVEGDDSFAG